MVRLIVGLATPVSGVKDRWLMVGNTWWMRSKDMRPTVGVEIPPMLEPCRHRTEGSQNMGGESFRHCSLVGPVLTILLDTMTGSHLDRDKEDRELPGRKHWARLGDLAEALIGCWVKGFRSCGTANLSSNINQICGQS